MRRLLKAVIIMVIVAGLGALAFVRFWPGERIAALADNTVQAEFTPMEDVLLVAGSVRPAVTIELRAEASGIVELVTAKQGDRVAAAEELVRLDSRVAQAALEQAEANLRQAELQDAATRLELDEDTLQSRRRTFQRAKALFDEGLVSREEMEQRELEARLAERTVERARRNIEGSQARIAQARAAVDQARSELQHTSIRAPFDAFVLRRQVEVGSGVSGVSQSASGGTVLMTLGDARESALYAKATAVDARRLRPGMPARIRLDSDAANPIPGVVESISTAGDVDQNSRLTTFPVVVALSTQPPGGWVNVPAQAEIVLAESVKSVTLPERCVTTDPLGQPIVRVRGHSGDRPRVVELGVVREDRIQIRAGLDEGQTVVCPSAPPQRSGASSPRAAAGGQPIVEPVQRER